MAHTALPYKRKGPPTVRKSVSGSHWFLEGPSMGQPKAMNTHELGESIHMCGTYI